MVEYTEPPSVIDSTPLRESMLIAASTAGYRLSTSAAVSETGLIADSSTPGLVSSGTQKLMSNSLSLPPLMEEKGCAECGEEISEKFYLYALNRRWHNCCLKCCVCNKQLEAEGSCYVKDARIYCKQDYFLTFGVQKCCRCYEPIQSGEMVMRAQSNVYHVHCFTCNVCNSHLRTGDHFGVCDNKIYCRVDFEQLQYKALNTVVALSIDPSSSQCSSILTTNISPESINMISTSCGVTSTTLPATHCINELTSVVPANCSLSPEETHYEDPGYGDYPPHLSHISYPLNSSIDQQPAVTKPQRSRKRRQQNNSAPLSSRGINGNEDTSWPHIGLTLLDTSVGGDTLTSTGYQHTMNSTANHTHMQHVKQKRMRTSFKHHQLKIMKQHFSLNHNPDAKELKNLSQKTGLSKRVLQVWFQNARAKFRRGQGDVCGEGRTEGSVNGDGAADQSVINDDDINSNDDLTSDTESHDEQSNSSLRSQTDFLPNSGSPLTSFNPTEERAVQRPTNNTIVTTVTSLGITSTALALPAAPTAAPPIQSHMSLTSIAGGV